MKELLNSEALYKGSVVDNCVIRVFFFLALFVSDQYIFFKGASVK